ncbi:MULTISPECIES: FRG domain-containing protein [unclassified Sphingopyxis]|jgi:hypothetical protein|uniref:FRG domain-containing protein n=1 Tax=unclassified Sphingopyxis TaxID=2614943 RepID=UPI0025DC62F8|nr:MULTISPECIES: FRG domain-containing protein [unclassified Sphingopyxis]
MEGQWLGAIEGEFGGTLRIEIERRDDVLIGAAYLFYDLKHELPGLLFPIRMQTTAPLSTTVNTIYLFSNGGRMSVDDRRRAEESLTQRFGELPIPPAIHVSFSENGTNLTVSWTVGDDTGTEILTKSEIEGPSQLVARTDLTTWDAFRQWAIDQKPRQFIFRGQTGPRKLATTFHRTWRNDLNAWIVDDVRMLFGAIMEQLSYPLQLGNLEHNAAVWSLLQHHGYPTPLLDWTFSPFVAAFFAFQNITHDDDRKPRIYIFDKMGWEAKYGQQAFYVDAAPPQLVALESISVGNPRSAPQQALSTVSNVADIEAFIQMRGGEDGATYLSACDIDPSFAPQIMRELELMGMTYGSLFPGLDGICRDMKDRLFGR